MRVSLQDNPAEEVDSALEKHDLRRQVALTLPHFTMAPALLAGADLVLTIVECTLEHLRLPEELALCKPPLAIPRLDYVQIWRGDAKREATGAWLWEQTRAAARKIQRGVREAFPACAASRRHAHRVFRRPTA